MQDIINKVLFYLKIFLLLISFSIIMYILFMMYTDYDISILRILLMFLSFFLVLVIFVVSLFFNVGYKNTMLNVASFLSLVAIFIISYRTLFDQNMVMWVKHRVNYYYFENQMFQIEILCWSIFIGNFLLIYKERKNR